MCIESSAFVIILGCLLTVWYEMYISHETFSVNIWYSYNVKMYIKNQFQISTAMGEMYER